MPPLDNKAMSIDVEHDTFHSDGVGVSVFSHKASIRSCLRKNTDECIDRTDTKMERSLHFQDTTSILWIEGIDSMTDEEIDDCYYNSRDYDGFRDRERRMQRNFSNWAFMKSGRKAEYLGVESRVQRFQRRQRTKNAVFAVLLEQELHTEKPHGDDSLIQEDLAIAQAYQQHTKESTRLARERANTNALQVNKSSSSVLNANGTSIAEVEMDKGEENPNFSKKNIDLPWEVPVSNKTQSNKNRPVNMIRYSTCAYLPSQYLNTIHCNEPNVLQKPSQSFRYFQHRKIQGPRVMLHGNGSQEAPIEQTIIRNAERHEFRNAMYHAQSQQHLNTEQNYHDPVTQQWRWNQIPYDIVPPANVPGLLPRDVY